MGSRIDITGQRFGHLTALYPLPELKRYSVMWVCQCDCGNTQAYMTWELRRGRVSTCGCSINRVKDIIGEKRGHLTALAFTGRWDSRRRAIYTWQCDCGNIIEHAIFPGTDISKSCPECVKALKITQVNEARRKRKTVGETGLSEKEYHSIIAGKPTKSNKSGVRGVCWDNRKQKWQVTGRENKKPVHLGYYDTLEEAREVRENFVMKQYGARRFRGANPQHNGIDVERELKESGD